MGRELALTSVGGEPPFAAMPCRSEPPERPDSIRGEHISAEAGQTEIDGRACYTPQAAAL